MRRVALSLLCTAFLATSPTGVAVGPTFAADVDAVAQWSMVPLSKDTNDDGIIDGDGGVPRSGALSLSPSPGFVGEGNRVAQPNERLIGGSLSWYLSDRGFPVRLDACESTGSRYRWRLSAPQQPGITTAWRRLSARTCAMTILLPEARYSLTLDVKAGASRASDTTVADVRNILVVALGDSYASGEGNPRNVEAWVRSGSAGAFDPYWDDDACHRSARGAPAQAALALEESSAHTSVTLVDVSCSGATVYQGLLGRSALVAASQIELARAVIGTRAVDLVTISVGGNDVGFTSVLQACALNADCPLMRASSSPLSSYPTVQDGLQAETAALAAKFRKVAACLGGASCVLADGRAVPPLAMSPTAHVLPSLYPDITRAATGQPCTYFTIAGKDFAWARGTILNPSPTNPYLYPLGRGGTASLSVAHGSLNQQIAATAALPGWTPVTAAWSASGDSVAGHGVCAGDQAWVFGVTLLSSMPSASFHPNIEGQRVLTAAISDAMRAGSISARATGAASSTGRAADS